MITWQINRTRCTDAFKRTGRGEPILSAMQNANSNHQCTAHVYHPFSTCGLLNLSSCKCKGGRAKCTIIHIMHRFKCKMHILQFCLQQLFCTMQKPSLCLFQIRRREPGPRTNGRINISQYNFNHPKSSPGTKFCLSLLS